MCAALNERCNFGEIKIAYKHLFSHRVEACIFTFNLQSNQSWINFTKNMETKQNFSLMILYFIENLRENDWSEFTLIVTLTKHSDHYHKRKLQKFALTFFTQKLRQINGSTDSLLLNYFHERFFKCSHIVINCLIFQRVRIKIRCLCFTIAKINFTEFLSVIVRVKFCNSILPVFHDL